jgi:hypothetical protein
LNKVPGEECDVQSFGCSNCRIVDGYTCDQTNQCHAICGDGMIVFTMILWVYLWWCYDCISDDGLLVLVVPEECDNNDVRCVINIIDIMMLDVLLTL